MFAIPGVAALIVFILVRPQEFIPVLQRVPFLHLFTAIALLGWVIDLRLRRSQPVTVPTLPWVLGFVAWAFVATAAIVPEKLIAVSLDLAVLFALYATMAHGLQRFRAFQAIAGAVVAACLFITVVCFHQAFAPKQCVMAQEGTDGQVDGTPDGRYCVDAGQCLGPDAEPGRDYRCEHVGIGDIYSTDERVRYRGELHDPNEVALTISAGALSLLLAFALRRRTPLATVVCVLAVVLVIATVLLTKSRGGLVSALIVPGVYVIRRYGVWAVIPGGALASTAILLGGRSGSGADVSTLLRYEAWANGLDMFKRSPLFGVGARQFGEHHFLTAHNSYVLTLAELGFVGMFLFVAVLYMTMKMLIVGTTRFARVPGTAAVQVWGMALLASLCGILFQINTLSFAYHSVLWLFLGLVGAWYAAIKHHAPEFEVRFGWIDFLLVAGGCVAYAFVLLPVFLRYKQMI